MADSPAFAEGFGTVPPNSQLPRATSDGASLRARLRADLVQALKAKDRVRSSTLRLVASALQNEEIALKKTSLTEEEVLRIVKQEAKRRRQAAEAYEGGGRPERAEAERTELDILSGYLPEPLVDRRPPSVLS